MRSQVGRKPPLQLSKVDQGMALGASQQVMELHLMESPDEGVQPHGRGRGAGALASS